VVFVLKTWRHYLYEVQFELFTNHKSLKYLFSQELNQRHRRWIKFIKDYEFTLQYHSRKANVIVDTLSRKPKCQLCSIEVFIISGLGDTQ